MIRHGITGMLQATMRALVGTVVCGQTRASEACRIPGIGSASFPLAITARFGASMTYPSKANSQDTPPTKIVRIIARGMRLAGSAASSATSPQASNP